VIIFGLPLWSISLLLLSLAWRQRFRLWRSGLVSALVVTGSLTLLALLLGWIIASSAEGAGRVLALANELDVTLTVRPDSPVTLLWGFSALVAIFPRVIGARFASPFLILALGGVLGLSTMAWMQASTSGSKKDFAQGDFVGEAPRATSLPFVLLLIGTGALLVLGPEFVYVRDNFGVRLNTVFKFYYQAWVMFGTAALFALAYLWHELVSKRRRLLPLLAITGYSFGLAISLLFPVFAIRSRAAEYRGTGGNETRQPATLDGLAQVNRFDPDEYAAVQWLRENVTGEPVIVEAVGGQYSSFGRISASTGLPTILGWAGHELQWRGSGNPEPGVREPAVRQIYTQPDWQVTGELLNRYGVEYIYVGKLEINTYGPRVNDKFEERLELAFRNDSVAIYRWQSQ
jgi:uncharacterized membrane protein